MGAPFAWTAFGPMGWLWLGGGSGASSGTPKIPADSINVSSAQRRLDGMYETYRGWLENELNIANRDAYRSPDQESAKLKIEQEIQRIDGPDFRNACRFEKRMWFRRSVLKKTGVEESHEGRLGSHLLTAGEDKYFAVRALEKGVWTLWSPFFFCRPDDSGKLYSPIYVGLEMRPQRRKQNLSEIEDFFQTTLQNEQSYLYRRWFQEFQYPRDRTDGLSNAGSQMHAADAPSDVDDDSCPGEEVIDYFDQDRGGYICTDGTFVAEYPAKSDFRLDTSAFDGFRGLFANQVAQVASEFVIGGQSDSLRGLFHRMSEGISFFNGTGYQPEGIESPETGEGEEETSDIEETDEDFDGEVEPNDPWVED